MPLVPEVRGRDAGRRERSGRYSYPAEVGDDVKKTLRVWPEGILNNGWMKWRVWRRGGRHHHLSLPLCFSLSKLAVVLFFTISLCRATGGSLHWDHLHAHCYENDPIWCKCITRPRSKSKETDGKICNNFPFYCGSCSALSNSEGSAHFDPRAAFKARLLCGVVMSGVSVTKGIRDNWAFGETARLWPV